MYPTPNTVIVPQFGDQPRPITIKEVRTHGRIVALSDDSTLATVEVKIPGSLVVSYCGVTLNEDGTIKDFIPRRVNAYSKITPTTEAPK